jgi:hypothetical protein
MHSLRTGVLLFLLLATGCSDRARFQVRGKVTYNGKPIGHQTLTLFHAAPDDPFAKRFPIAAADGAFAGEVPKPGTYKVYIEPSMAAMEGMASADEMHFPEKYRDKATSGLEWDVKPGLNERDFDLQ